ncbi:hypothetical protein Cs7R123_57600 [Catellatospora sp. TT07R-123]|uniref:DUF1697 domain-containing protein n=1 Tax=Catellatospora sp. TT07R-123 TaxID=2733863 RepID=UPI001B1EFC23|nr:DUF1697 domain-containing protein [Catellatospora sp. TT07R-123]GHJ48418.1 hypothetical protein Cs7R123_57600 [Catellatospora sp. TT07R-123]
MNRYVALLRGINVGRNKQIPMADLKDLLAGLGHTDVSTYLRSGNALFTSDGTDEEALAEQISAAIAARFGAQVGVLVRGRDELAAITAADPLADRVTDPARYLVVFLSAPVTQAVVDGIDRAAYGTEVMVAGRREVYVWLPDGIADSKLTQAFFQKRLSVDTATARNWNTVTKLTTLP